MPWIMMAVKFLRKYWKQIGVAIVASLIMVGIASLYARAVIAEGQVEKMEAQVEALELRDQAWSSALDQCVEANKAWAEIIDGIREEMEDISLSRDSYLARLQEALRAREEAREELADLQASVTSETCSGAIRELVVALQWGER